MKNIAVIGAGISGLAAAYLLSRRHRVQLFEKEARLGGHTSTVVYRHPLYTREAIGAQQRWREVSGVNRTHFCGAYWFHGFHEDGLNSALRVAGALGVEW